MSKRVGVVVGHEESFSSELIKRCNQRPGIVAEMAQIGGTAERHVSRYDVLIDRLSHKVPHYRAFLKAAVLAGTTVLNDPFRCSADDRFFAVSLAARMGLQVPRTVLLPQKNYDSSVNLERSLHNLEYPLNWAAIIDYVRFPAILKPIGAINRDVSIVKDAPGLMSAFDASGQGVTMLQQLLKSSLYLRCLCVGGQRALAVQYDPLRHCYVYHDDDDWLAAPLRDQVLGDALKVTRALGYDLGAVEVAVVDSVGWIVDASNPAAELHREALGGRYFDVLVDWMVDLVERCARGEARTVERQSWAEAISQGRQ